MNEIVARGEREKLTTTARISPATAEALERQRLALSALAGRELTNNDVIAAMHAVFVRQPATIIAQAVQP